MTKRDILMSELKQMPEVYLDQLSDFIQFLKMKIAREKLDIALMSETSLKKDWLKPEEDEAWQNL